MSFAIDVKNELARVIPKSICCKKSELISILQLSSTVFNSDSSFKFVSSSAAIARKILQLSNAIAPEIATQVAMQKATRLRKNNRYIIIATRAEKIHDLLEIFADIKKIRRDCCKKSILRGAFLGSGSINKPESDYRLELTSRDRLSANFLLELLQRMDFPAKMYERNRKFIVYLGDGESILDFLSMTRATTSAEQFESARNLKEIRGQVNSLINFETANLQKSAEAISRHLEDIEKLERADLIKDLPSKIVETIDARKNNPESSLSELADILKISKPTLNYRFKKIHSIAGGI